MYSRMMCVFESMKSFVQTAVRECSKADGVTLAEKRCVDVGRRA